MAIIEGSRVEVLTGKLEGRSGSVLELRGGLGLVSEDGPDDQDDWVPMTDLRELGEWAGPPMSPCHAIPKPGDVVPNADFYWPEAGPPEGYEPGQVPNTDRTLSPPD